MLVSFTIGWGVALFVAVALLWFVVSAWPSKSEPDFFGVGAFIDGAIRTFIGLVGTIVLLVAYIVLKLVVGV